jgi:hypothetical protein
MVFCSNCGMKLLDGTKTCPHCGASVASNVTPSPDYSVENTSGMGKATILPPEIKGWNWGAFWLTWIWGIRNRTYIAFLTFIPYVGFVMPFILGAKGNKWAWQNQKWDSIEQYKASQKRWAMWGLIIFIIVISVAIGFGILASLMPYLFPIY